MSRRRVVITGLGIVSPVGSTVESAWRNVLEGKSGIGPITRFDVSAFPVALWRRGRRLQCGAIPSPQGAAQDGSVHALRFRRRGRRAQGLGPRGDTDNAPRIGVAMGAGIGGLDTIEENYDKYIETDSPKKISPFFVPGSIINMIPVTCRSVQSSPVRTSRR